MYGSLGIVGFVSGRAFYFCFYPGRDRKVMDQGHYRWHGTWT
ncbi:H+/oligopeptide symporter [Colletotrichum limetticola]|uniref:H+/oligopeptide symporter n=1 Tax=Colletotrichum limetticola TaxID=1209924 RepID=A0ABQ9PYL0_9PEZI|nr:H+/oligopeptide symporter [Colletotrichum limetticola]